MICSTYLCAELRVWVWGFLWSCWASRPPEGCSPSCCTEVGESPLDKAYESGKKTTWVFWTLTLKDVKQLHTCVGIDWPEYDPYLWCDTDCRAPRSCWGSWGNSVRRETGQGRRKGRRRRWSRAAEGRSPGRWRSGASGARCAGRRSGTLPAGCVEGWTRCDAGPAPAAALSGDRKDGRCCCKISNYCFWLRNTVFDHCHRAPQKLHCYDIRILRWDYFFTAHSEDMVYLESPRACSGTGWRRCPSAWSRRGTRSTPGPWARGGTAGRASATLCSRWRGAGPSCGTPAASRPETAESSRTCLMDSDKTAGTVLLLSSEAITGMVDIRYHTNRHLSSHEQYL